MQDRQVLTLDQLISQQTLIDLTTVERHRRRLIIEMDIQSVDGTPKKKHKVRHSQTGIGDTRCVHKIMHHD